MSYTCPFCGWPSLRMTNAPAEDELGNKYHHAFSKPGPFDSLIGHPIDHTFSALCQIAPMFIYRMHLLSFLVYSSLLSLNGIFDHSGIKLKKLGYSTINLHIHHMYPHKNFGAGFPLLIWDILHGSYQNHM